MGVLAVTKVAADRNFWDWIIYFIHNNWSMLLRGAGITLLIAISGTVIGFFIGLLIGVIRTIPKAPNSNIVIRILRWILNFILSAYIEVFRGTPMIVQAAVIFYGIPIMTGVHLQPLFAGFIIVSINTGAYISEIVRGGILSIDKGQFEAAHSVGMTHAQTMVTVILPQAIRNILPSIGNEFVINIKDTSVLNVISVTELYFTANTLANTFYKYFESFFIASVMYFIMTFTVTRILRAIERRMDGPSSYRIHGSQTTPESELKVEKGGGLV